MSRLLIVNMTSFVINISLFFKWKNYTVRHIKWHWDTLDDRHAFEVCKGKMFLSVLMASVMSFQHAR